MISWGISANSHDAALAVFKNTNQQIKLCFASHSERFSGIKNDADLDQNLIDYAKQNWGEPNEIFWYERPLVKSLRQLRAGQGFKFKENNIRNYLESYGIHSHISYTDHHLSHAAAGYYTSGFDKACIVCIDSIGEFDTFTIWSAQEKKIQRVFNQRYPQSIGLWYSAMTQRIGLKPNEDEYILMGMAAYGNPNRFYKDIIEDFILKWPDMTSPEIKFKHNLHKGCKWWRPELQSEQDYFDIAAAVQSIYENIFECIIQYIAYNFETPNLVIMGGCALNCSANSIAYKYYNNVWIMPNPGDAGSALGCVLAHKKQHIDFDSPYLGYNIPGEYPVDQIIQELKTSGICGVASGSAEFGPRALGNRSLLADPRGTAIKQKVNDIKQRQQFRPFAPAILAEHVEDYFEGITGPYMQYTAVCKYPDLYPAIVHQDNTSRVQVVDKNCQSGFRLLLEKWYQETQCPMLLNTSLNIKGKPMVNNIQDAEEFQKKYKVKVCMPAVI